MAAPKSLKAWHHAFRLSVECAEAADAFPAIERFNLADQLRRAGYSPVLNIAEGASRYGRREFRRFLDTARSSLDEVETILEIAIARGYIDADHGRQLKAIRDETARTVYGLLRAVSDDGDDERHRRKRSP
jgi:four helix bundle protein